MNLREILKKEKNNLFHFYIILGNLKKNSEIVKDFLEEELSFYKNGSRNFYYFAGEDLSIDSARKIKKANSIKSNEELRIFLIESQKFENEVQNALLKTFEEPQKNTIFFLLLPQNIFLLDTIGSRARILKGENDFFNYDLVKSFAEGSYSERQKIIDKISDKEKFNSRKKREIFLNLIWDLDFYFLDKNKKWILKNPEIYRHFLELKEETLWRGSNLKNILVYLAIIFPSF